MKNIFLSIAAFLLVTSCVVGQQFTSYNQFFSNPALYNPSFLGQSGYTELNINHRQQWMGIEGAPVTTNANIQAPLSDKFALGLVLFSDKLGLITTYETTAGLSYNIKMGPSSRLAFGLTAGVGRNEIEFINNDPAYANALDKSFYFSGQFGLNFTMDRLTVGFSLPQLMESQFAREENFDEIGLEATRLTFSSIAYRFDLGPKVTLEPTVFYQSDQKTVDQLGGLVAVTYNELFWFGGGYRQEQGANAFVGFNINDFIKVGYAYEFAPAAIASELNNGTHEFQIGIRLGKKNKREVKTLVSNDIIPETEQPEEDEPVDEPIEEEIVIEETTSDPIQKEEPEETISETEEEQLNQPEEEETPEEKPRVVKPGELAPGYYVVVGAYHSKANAETYMRSVRASGYHVSIGYYPETGLNYIYIKHTQDKDMAIKVRNEIRKIYEFEFREAWVLDVK